MAENTPTPAPGAAPRTSYELLDEAARRRRIRQSIAELDERGARRHQSLPERRRFSEWFVASRCDAELADIVATLDARGNERARALGSAWRESAIAALVYPMIAAAVFVLLRMPAAGRIAVVTLLVLCILRATAAALELRQFRRTRHASE